MASNLAATPGGSAQTSSPAPAVTRAAAVLDVLAASPSGRATLSDLARALGIPKSSTSNLLQALEDARLITRQGSDFSLGRKLVELGAAYLSRRDEVQEFYRFCEEAPTLSRETVRIAMLDGDQVIYLARYEGHPAVRLTSSIGDKMRWAKTSMGYYIDGALYPWGDPIALMRFPKLSLIEKLRYGAMMFFAVRRTDWRSLENLSAKTWIMRW